MATSTDLPAFAYHPDPIATGSVVPSDTACVCCGHARGYVYDGPVFTAQDVPRRGLCPWCIADGSAAARYDATFTELDGPRGTVSDDVLDTVARRTPGFSGWQQERWLVHCGDGAMFLGHAGARELAGDQGALDCLRAEPGSSWQPAHVESYLAALDRDGQPTAYLFACRHCGAHLAYSDAT